MRDEIRDLFGSEHENQWRFEHKEIAKTLPEAEYWNGSNGDFFLMQNHIPIALIDIKPDDRPVTPTEKDLYNWHIRKGLPVFIVRGQTIWTTIVYKYEIGSQEVWVDDDYINWERGLRNKAREFYARQNPQSR